MYKKEFRHVRPLFGMLVRLSGDLCLPVAQIDCPQDSHGRRKRHTILEGEVTEVDRLYDRPDLPVDNKDGKETVSEPSYD
jgi:hypothetical protein